MLWPQGFAGGFDRPSALLAAGAAVALFRYPGKVIEVLGACAALGLVVSLLG